MTTRRQAPTTFEALKEVHRFVEAMYTGGSYEGWTVELEDENDPDGNVVFKDERGVVKMWMPRDVYEDFKNM